MIHCLYQKGGSTKKTEEMKYLIVFLLLLPVVTVAQATYGNWSIENANAVFVKVYEVEDDSASIAETLKAYLLNLGYVKNIEVLDSRIYANLEGYQVDYKRQGFGDLSAPFIFSSGLWRGRIIAQVKENKYRIQITDIAHSTKLYGLSAGGLQDSEVNGNINDVLLKKDKSGFRKNALRNADALGNDLEYYFMIKGGSKSDW